GDGEPVLQFIDSATTLSSLGPSSETGDLDKAYSALFQGLHVLDHEATTTTTSSVALHAPCPGCKCPKAGQVSEVPESYPTVSERLHITSAPKDMESSSACLGGGGNGTQEVRSGSTMVQETAPDALAEVNILTPVESSTAVEDLDAGVPNSISLSETHKEQEDGFGMKDSSKGKVSWARAFAPEATMKSVYCSQCGGASGGGGTGNGG
ncbi:unnamed protein product, partial [Choristocarpus tenellus]